MMDVLIINYLFNASYCILLTCLGFTGFFFFQGYVLDGLEFSYSKAERASLGGLD